MPEPAKAEEPIPGRPVSDVKTEMAEVKERVRLIETGQVIVKEARMGRGGMITYVVSSPDTPTRRHAQHLIVSLEIAISNMQNLNVQPQWFLHQHTYILI